MKIGLTTTSFRWDQGAERFVVNLAKGLLIAGHEVHVIGRLEKHNVLDEFHDQLTAGQQNRFTFHRIKTIKATRYLNLITFAYAVHRVLRNERFDIVQGFGKSLGLDVFRPPTGTHKAFMAGKQGKPNREPCTLMEYAIEKRLLFEQSKMLVVNSNLSLERIRKVYPGIEIPANVIPNMVDLKYWQEADRSHDRKRLRSEWQLTDDDVVFLHVSTSFQSKGVPEILEAYDTLEAKLPQEQLQRIKIVLVGDDSFRSDEKYGRNISSYSRTNDVRPYFFAADVLLHPTRFDSFANVVLEALACGLPVVTTRFNGAVDAIDHNRDGCIINRVDAEEIADTINFFLDDKKRNEMSVAARVKSSTFSPETIICRYLELYENLVPKIKNSKKRLTLRPWEFLGE